MCAPLRRITCRSTGFVYILYCFPVKTHAEFHYNNPILTGDPISTEEVLSFGLVMKVVAKDKLLQEAKGFAAKLASLPRLALEASKMLINRGLEMDLASALELEARCFGNLAASHDLREGILAFLEKRKPDFKD